jgi:MFS family permease
MLDNWALDNLQVIRALMESSAVYRRAVAPIMGVVGMIGITAGVIGALLNLETPRLFVVYWVLVALVCLTVAFFMIRRQALKEVEVFWTPPTRRVAQAVAPAFFAGLMAAVVFFFMDDADERTVLLLAPVWMVLYGLAMHSAGFFMPRGFRLFGWGFIGCGLAFLGCWIQFSKPDLAHPDVPFANLAMGGFFGVGHAAYGLYLHFTKKPGNAA